MRMNNPAARLLTILREIKSTPPSAGAVQTWAKIFGVEEGNSPVLLRRLGQVLSLPVQVKQEIERQQDIDYDIYLKWMPSVQEAFNTLNLSGNIASFHNPISEVTLHGL